MRHEAGMPIFPMHMADLSTSSIKRGAVSDLIEKKTPKFPNGSRDVADRAADPHNLKRWREYHSESRGWIVNEIVRRADPRGRTVGEIVKEDLAGPLGLENELFVGSMTDAQAATVEDLTYFSNWRTWTSMVLPGVFGGGRVPVKYWVGRLALVLGIPLYELLFSLGFLRAKGKTVANLTAPEHGASDLANSPNFVERYNSPEVRNMESPSTNGHASARALAKLAAAVVGGGCVAGVRVLSEEACVRAQGGGVLNSMGAGGRLTNADFRAENRYGTWWPCCN